MIDQSEEAPLQPASPSPPVDAQYRGVGGWLLFLCVSLTILAPLITLIVAATGFSDSLELYDQFPGLLVTVVIDSILSVGLMAFSIYAGIGLWSIRPGAVQTAKAFLWCYLGYHIIAAILPFMAGLPSAVNELLIEETSKDTFRSIIYFAIWYSYLNQSKRVKATYNS